MIDIKKAKVKLLSLAFQGALVDYPNKEKSNKALNDIHGKQKGFAPVETEEYLIAAPSYWGWSRLGYITKNHGQIVPDTDFCYIDVGTLDNVHQRLAEKENLVNAKDAPSRARKIVQLGDVLYSTVRPYLHNICIIDKDFSRTPIASTAFCVMQANESVLLNKYLFFWLLTPEFDKYSNGDPSKGALYPAIGEKDLLRGVIPLPSVDEQRLIVEKIEQAFSVLDTIDELQAKYADNLTALKSKLIDLAIRGKLTEQLPEDGTAEELYQQIQEEKQALIKSGKIKKEKPLPEIAEDEMPFEIPDSWKWVRVASIWQILNGDRGKNYPAKTTLSHTGIPFISALNLDGQTVVKDDQLLCVSETQFNKLGNGKLQKGDIVVCIRGSLGKHGRYPFEKGAIASSLVIMRSSFHNEIMDDYLMLYLDSPLFFAEITKYDNGTAQPNLAAKSLEQFLLPLPPLTEQKRIVAKIEELLPLCEKIKEKR